VQIGLFTTPPPSPQIFTYRATMRYRWTNAHGETVVWACHGQGAEPGDALAMCAAKAGHVTPAWVATRYEVERSDGHHEERWSEDVHGDRGHAASWLPTDCANNRERDHDRS